VLSRLFRRLRPPVAAPPAVEDPLPGREQRLAERLLEDEALRGDLDDATWQPIQDWLLAVVKRVAASTAGLDDTAAQPILDQAQARLRAAVVALGEALAAGPAAPDFIQRLEAVQGELRPPIVDGARAGQARSALRSVAVDVAGAGADRATAAQRLVSAIELGGNSRSAAPPGNRA